VKRRNLDAPRSSKQVRAEGFLLGAAFGVLWIATFALYLTNTGRFASADQASEEAHFVVTDFLCSIGQDAKVEIVHLRPNYPRRSSATIRGHLHGSDIVWSYEWTAIDKDQKLVGRVEIWANWTRAVYLTNAPENTAPLVLHGRRIPCTEISTDPEIGVTP
jgi:hypothetical protein